MRHIAGMALNSQSTLADAEAQYLNNLGWEGDMQKASAALEAIRFLLLMRPSRWSISGRSIDYESLLDEKQRLEKFVSKASGARASFVRARAVY